MDRPDPASQEQLIVTFGELFSHMRAHFERVVGPFDMPPPCAKALHLIDDSMSMKELGSRIHCDASFVTAIADSLEERGLVRREVDAGDRRIKNLVLTAKGKEVRSRLLDELFTDVPGFRNLEAAEAETLLALLRKMVARECERAGAAPDPGCAA
jgi:DNA-binding MarR family transcriptional regulator